MQRAYYTDTIDQFLVEEPEAVLGRLAKECEFAVEQTQRDAWLEQIDDLKTQLTGLAGSIYFEFAIPRMGKRVDVVLVIGPVVFVVEYKVGEDRYPAQALDQVTDYALDLKNFHEPSHDCFVAPILIATQASSSLHDADLFSHHKRLFKPMPTHGRGLRRLIDHILHLVRDEALIDQQAWRDGRYQPTPTIVEAAVALYSGHGVSEISRSDAGGQELRRTTQKIGNLIADARNASYKAVCFVTGVPGAGKTLIGLNVATKHIDLKKDQYSVFLSGNGPLVKILQEALARDKVRREANRGKKLKKGDARSQVKMFIQNVHHYRDECLRDLNPPVDHVALFDEAQRAWNLQQTTNFMRTKKKLRNFHASEPEFLLSCIDRHPDWGVVICLVGGGQEINKGEAGIGEWVAALQRSFPQWHIHISDRLHDSEFGAGAVLAELDTREHVYYDSRLHLGVSMRSFRAEHVSEFVKHLLDLDDERSRTALLQLGERYPIVITRDLQKAKNWLRQRAAGSERYGIVVSSQANRLKPLAIDVRLKPNPVHWFLADKSDVRSSYYLEDVATEFDIQGLELDWACVTWDADLRMSDRKWSYHSFRGKKWQTIRSGVRKGYLKNAYRVLLTRARQGMVIVVPSGDTTDPTRDPAFYDPTFQYLKQLQLPELD